MPIKVQTRTPLPMAMAPSLAPPGGAWVNVPYVVQSQTNWCWAACGEMLLRERGQNGFSQCRLASDQFRLVCCGSVAPGCNLGCWPENSYPNYQLPVTRLENALDAAGVRAQLAAGRPVQVCYRWTGSSNTHVALIIGEYPNGDFEVLDPWSDYGRGPRQFSQIASAYGLGTWIISFTF